MRTYATLRDLDHAYSFGFWRWRAAARRASRTMATSCHGRVLPVIEGFFPLPGKFADDLVVADQALAAVENRRQFPQAYAKTIFRDLGVQ